MTDQDAISGTERDEIAQQPASPPTPEGAGQGGAGQGGASQGGASQGSASQGSASRVGASRVVGLIGRHKLASAIVALLVAAAIAGVAGGSLNGSPAASGGGSPASGDGAVVYAHPTQAPAFSLPDLTASGQQVGLSQYQGKPLIVNFFASWCGPCQQETPLLARFYKQQGGRVTILGVDGNDPTANAVAFVHAKGVTYPVGADKSLITASAYNVAAFPQTFFLNASHQIVYQVFGAVTQAELSKGASLMRG
ncbi:MAG TPA: TlpA disulfide reductase family protein [Trebonia sp.]|nr:TlpA disulfide reductase family protein [Trebonia sp.]